MKKRQSFFSLIVILGLIVLVSCNRTMDDYYYDLEEARKAESCYDVSDYLFTIQMNDKVVDFIVNDETLCVVKIDCRERLKKQYNVKSVGVYSLEDALHYSKVHESPHWVKTGNFQVPIEWSFITEEIFSLNPTSSSFEVAYNGEIHYLCYRTVE